MTARGIHTCCPEAPSTINITQQILTLDGSETFFMNEQFLGSQVAAQLLTLSKLPYTAASVELYYNSGDQRLGVDYTVVNDKILFNFPVAPDAKINVRYLAVGVGVSTIVGASLATGITVGYGSVSTPPTGWLLMDGVTKVYTSVYSALFAFLANNLHLTDGTGVNTDGGGNYYVLKSLPTSYYTGSSFVTGNTIIKT